MFYSHTLFSRKGPLGTVWIAAFCFKKLKKEQITNTDISSSIDQILPETQMSYRVLAQLLLGIVRIYSKKVDYLYNDCNEALIYINKSFITSQYSLKRRAVARSRTRVKETNKSTQDKKRIKETNENTLDMNRNKETNENTQDNNRANKANESAQDQNIIEFEENIYMQPEEAMFAPYDPASITIPERFELDTFDLGDLDNGDASETYEQPSPQDHILNADIQDLFLEQGRRSERYVNEDYNYACFTPVNEVLASNIMDIDLEISEEINLSSVNVRGEDVIAEKGYLEHVKNNESLPPQRLNASKESLPHENINEAIISLQPENLETNELNEDNMPLPLERFNGGDESLDPQRPADANKSLPPNRLNEELEILIQPIKLKGSERSNLEEHLKDHSLSVDTLSNQADLPALVDKESKPEGYNKSRSPLGNNLGIPSPKIMLITPARKEQRRTTQKKKRIFDENTVLSNETLRMGICDTSSLLRKRQKARHKLLDVWRANKISTLHKTFLEPLIPISCSKVEFVREAKSSLDLPKKTPTDYNVESANVEDRTCMEIDCQLQERVLKEQQEAVTEEPQERVLEEHHDRVHEVHQDILAENIEAESYSEEHRNHKSYEVSQTDSELDLMNQECGSDEDSINRDNVWPVKTCSLEKNLLRKIQVEGGDISLGQMLQGQTRTECAKLFFETLVLKGKDCIDVKQERPYGDIILSALPKLGKEQ